MPKLKPGAKVVFDIDASEVDGPLYSGSEPGCGGGYKKVFVLGRHGVKAEHIPGYNAKVIGHADEGARTVVFTKTAKKIK